MLLGCFGFLLTERLKLEADAVVTGVGRVVIVAVGPDLFGDALGEGGADVVVVLRPIEVSASVALRLSVGHGDGG